MREFKLFTIRERKTARDVARGLADSLPTAHCPLPTPKRGISLLEVLISMFVLLFGLMGVASLFPVGNHYAAQGEQFDRSTALSDAAFDELLARGILKPQFWLYGDINVRQDTETGASPPPEDDYLVINPLNDQFNISLSSAPQVRSGRAFVIDPIGVASALPAINAQQEHNHFFPYLQGADQNATMPVAWNMPPPTWTLPANTWPIQESTWPIRRVSLPGAVLGQPMPLLVADTIFSLHDTLSVELPDGADRPAIQRWKTADVNPLNGNVNNTPDNPADDTLLRREYEANYTWIASVVPVSNQGLEALQPASSQYGNKAYDVSVAVFHRREEAPSDTSERLLEAELLPGGELILYNSNTDDATAKERVDNALDDLRPGNWIAVAGVNQTNGTFLMKWYRLLSLDNDTTRADEQNMAKRIILPSSGSNAVTARRAMLDGPDWPATPDPGGGPNPLPFVANLRAIVLPGIVSVTTRSIPMQQD